MPARPDHLPVRVNLHSEPFLQLIALQSSSLPKIWNVALTKTRRDDRTQKIGAHSSAQLTKYLNCSRSSEPEPGGKLLGVAVLLHEQMQPLVYSAAILPHTRVCNSLVTPDLLLQAIW